MILSKKNKFVFIKGKKVAGTSLEALLSNICGPNDIITPITPIDEQNRLKNGKRTAQNFGSRTEDYEKYIEQLKKLPKNKLSEIVPPKGNYYNHMPFVDVVNLFGEIPDDWTIFAVERCPYRKIISLANFQLGFQQYKSSGSTIISSLEKLKQQISNLIKYKRFVSVKNIELYKNKDGFLMTSILRYENLNEEVNGLMLKLGISEYPKMQHFKKGMLSNNMDLHDIFSSEQLRIINDAFHDEFELFGYEMFE